MEIKKVIENLIQERDAERVFYVTEESIKEHKEQCDILIDMLKAEEKGLLLRLPCPVDSTVYLICSRYTKCTEHDQELDDYSCQGCDCLECDSHKEYYIHVNNSVSLEWIVRYLKEFGKTVFLTQEEAEQALAELKAV